MRNMSFSMTTRQMREKTKSVTRRLGWEFLRPGDRVMAIIKGQGLKKGEKVERICEIRIVSNRRERLSEMHRYPYGTVECQREGFPEMSPSEFIAMFCKANACRPTQKVNRIEFDHV